MLFGSPFYSGFGLTVVGGGLVWVLVIWSLWFVYFLVLGYRCFRFEWQRLIGVTWFMIVGLVFDGC